MPIKVLQFAQVQGMNQDLSPSKRTDKLAYEIKNMRISIEDGNTLLSWTNEKGTKSIVAPIPDGKALGTCTVNNELIIFIKGLEYDYIYGVYNLELSPLAICYYKGNLDLREDKKIETLAIIENSKLHKVYWIDGVHLPRFINIANKEVKEWGAVYSSDNTLFDFLPTDDLFKLNVTYNDGTTEQIERTLKVNILKLYQTGLFKAGTIQYAFSYYNLNGALTNLVYLTPILYISLLNRGCNVDDAVDCAFKIKCQFINKKFDYLRIYSISRTSTDTTPLARIVTDIPTKNAFIEHVSIEKQTTTRGRRAPKENPAVYYLLEYSLSGEELTSFSYKQVLNSVVGNVYRISKYEITNSNGNLLRLCEYKYDLKDFIIGDENPVELNVGDVLVWGNDVYYANINARIRITKKEESYYPGYYTYTLTPFIDSGHSPYGGALKLYKKLFIGVTETSDPDLPETPSVYDFATVDVPTLEFIDNGTTGSVFDYNGLLFMNNNSMVPNTMDLKDNTLFLGNYKYDENKDLELKTKIEESGITANSLIKFINVPIIKDSTELYYPYTNQNIYSANKIMGFKGGESYIFGFMVLDMHDRWSSVIAFKDIVTNTVYPKVEEPDKQLLNKSDIKNYTTYIVQAVLNTERNQDESLSLYDKLLDIINKVGSYKAIKFVITQKNAAQRNVICQGVLSPTVFCQENRIRHLIPFAQSSWFFRPMMKHNPSYYVTEDSSMVPEFRHYNLIGGEIQSSYEVSTDTNYDIQNQTGYYFEKTAGYTYPVSYSRVYSKESASSPLDTLLEEYLGNTKFGVDNQIITMHSPDIEFDSTVLGLLDDNNVLLFRIIGYTKVHSTYSDASISVKLKHFFYENNKVPKIGTINTDNDKQVNTYNQLFPAAGLSVYRGVYGDTWYYQILTDELGVIETNAGELSRCYYDIYPWHRSTSLNAQPSPSAYTKEETQTYNTLDDSYWQVPLEHKEISNVRVCCKTKLGFDYIWRPLTTLEEGSDKRGIGNINIWYPTDKVTKLKDSDEPWENEMTYEGNIDTIVNVSPKKKYRLGFSHRRGGGTIFNAAKGILQSNDLIRMKYKSSTHAVFNLGFNKYNVDDKEYYQLWVLPNIKNNDIVVNNSWGSSKYQTVSWDKDVEGGFSSSASLSYRDINCYNGIDDATFKTFVPPRIGIEECSSEELRLVAEYCRSKISNFKYEEGEGYYVFIIFSKYSSGRNIDAYTELEYELFNGVVIHHIAYDKDRHIAEEYVVDNSVLKVGDCIKGINANGENKNYGVWSVGKRILVREIEELESSSEEQIISGLNIYTTKDYTVDEGDDGIFYIGELYLNTQLSTENHELEGYNWQAASDTISLAEDTLPNLYGDTYFQRYDCLKTYSYAPDDPNQIVDIGSFMLETRINIDGRYDRNRGLVSNLNITDLNFNLLNKAYTQNDYFVTSYIDNNNLDVNNYSNTVTWSLTKVYGEPIDNWTHLTSTNNLDLDGDRGTLTKIINFQDTLLFFQTEGAGLIKYNENVALAATNELPVELANSGKVDGKLYLNRIIGCLNKDTIVITTNALYFIDGNTNSIYQVTSALGLVSPLSVTANSFEGYMKALNLTTAKGFYNKDKQEIYYIFDNDKAPCITYNEISKTFTSFYDYKPDFFECIGETAYHLINKPSTINIINEDTLLVMNPYIEIWALNKGDYNKFYGEVKPFYFTISANGQDGITDKIWNNIEFRSDTYEQGLLQPDATFNELNVWNEHQVGTSNLTLYGHLNSINSPSSLKRKFRIWRANIPRASFVPETLFIDGINDTVEHSIQRGIPDKGLGRNRIRNPWTFIQLKNSNPLNYKTTLHDLMVYYFE